MYQFDRDTLGRFLAATDAPVGDAALVREVRGFNTQRRRGGNSIVRTEFKTNMSGWFDRHADLIAEAARFEGASAYITVNPVNPLLLYRQEPNQILRCRDASDDGDILARRWAYIDMEAQRPDGISATPDELQMAVDLRETILGDFPQIRASSLGGLSGNGCWTLVRLGDLPNDGTHGASYDMISRFLAFLADRFGKKKRDPVYVDETTKNAGRVMCLPGTLKCKGVNAPERPWRMVTMDWGEPGLPAFDLAGFVAEYCPKPERKSIGFATRPGVANGRATQDEGWRPPLEERIGRYLATKEPAISGDGGSNPTFDVACSLVKGFALSPDEAMPFMRSYNERCIPPWSEEELRHKLESADRKGDDRPRGYLKDQLPSNWQGREPVAHPGQIGRRGAADPEPVDVPRLIRRAEELVEANRMDQVYRDSEFLLDLARLEAAQPGEAEAIKESIRKIAGYRERGMKAAMDPHRPPKAGKFRGFGADGGRDGHGGGEGGDGGGGDDRPMFDLTDLGNGKRLTDRYGPVIRFCKSYGDWMLFDGRRWVKDGRNRIEQYAQEIPAMVLAETPPDPNKDVIEAYRKWSFDSQSKDRMLAAITMARSMNAIEPDELDRDPWLLNVANGTIDLRSGGFREHRPADLVTKMANVVYDPDATCPRWDQFIREIMLDDVELANYLRRVVGYAITGVVREHALFFFHGSGRNGKSMLLGTIKGILGDYSNEIDSDLLISHNVDKHPTGLTELEGRRFVFADESDDGRNLAEAQIKKLTGGNGIQARKIGKDFYTFSPSHHLFFASNHRPDIRGMDPGIWARIKPIPFLACYDPAQGGKEPDLELEHKLAAEASGILNWMLRGCREWQQMGLTEPTAVVDATREYRGEMDVLGRYTEENCLRRPADKGIYEKISDLYSDYVAWCERFNHRPLSVRKFSSHLTDRGHATWKSNSVAYKLGIKKKTEAERYAEEQAAQEEARRRFQPEGEPEWVAGNTRGRAPF